MIFLPPLIIMSKKNPWLPYGKPRKKKAKYRNEPTYYNTIRYASKAEAGRAKLLDMMVEAGTIQWWIGQPKFRLGVPENVYVPDFLVVGGKEGLRVEDVKGRETPKFLRDKNLWQAYGPCPLWIIKDKRVEIIDPKES